MFFKYFYITVLIVFYTFKGIGQVNTSTTETHKILSAKGNFNIHFIDTVLPKTYYVEAIYESDNGYSFKFAKKGTAYTLGINPNYYVFEFIFNKAFQDSFKIGKEIQTISLHEIWQLILGLNNPNSNGSVAGTLLLANKIAVLDNYATKFKDYESRRLLREKYLNSKESNLVSKIQTQKSNLLKAAIAINDKLSKAGAGAKPPIQMYDTSVVKSENFRSLLNEIALSSNYFNVDMNTQRMTAYTTTTLTPPTVVSNSYTPKFRKDSIGYSIDTSFVNKSIRDIIKNQIKYSTFIDSCQQNDICRIKNVEIQFERGFIEKIKVLVNYKNGLYFFENIYAVGFSSFLNYKSLSNIRLYIRNREFNDNPYIYLSDVIRDYDNRLANYTRDYSPEDTTINVDPNVTSDITLSRASYVNIIDAKVFTDLNGTKKNNPNGLFQIELNKRFNINTARYQTGSLRGDVGFFNYVNLFAAVNKIEQNNRYLTLHNANVTQNGSIISPNYATNLDFLRYENYTAGFSLNGALLDLPDGKFTIYGDLGLKYGYLNIADSVLTPQKLIKNPNYFPEAHTVTFYLPKIGIELFSESRISVYASYNHNFTYLFSNNAEKQVVSYQKSDLTATTLEKRARRSNVFELSAKLMPNKDRNTHIFARLRFYTQNGDANTSFSQIQIGYAYNLTFNK